MDLNIIWFILIAVLWTGYFALDGFDLGVGILLPFLGKDDTRRRIILNTIGPHWDGNEVWLITAGGATFAAFPGWYATLFSGFYLPLFLILIALILRGIAFEFRSKDENPHWRSLWDWCAFTGSLVTAILWGVAFANFIRGVPIDAELQYAGGFWNLLNPFALLGGLVSLTGLVLYGSVFLSLKTGGDLMEDARRTARRVWPVASIVMIAFAIAAFATKIISGGAFPVVVTIAAVLALLVSAWFIFKQREGWAFSFLALSVVFTMSAVFITLFPNVLISLGNPANNLTIYNVSSSPATLKLMTIVAVIFLPIVLAYQGWSYWIFRKRITNKPEDIQALKY
jgi:cytochrome d ubiquinol oxidase subunit II